MFVEGLDADPFLNAVHRGIKRDITVCMENGCFRAVVLLLYAAIDAMGYTTLPPGDEKVTRKTFEAWADRWVRIPGPAKVTSKELYAARCAALHTYGTDSDLSRSGTCRAIGYFRGRGTPAVIADSIEPDVAFVSIDVLCDAVLQGIDDYADELARDDAKWAAFEKRLHNFLQHSAVQS
jgi:hypothetical protein